LKKGTKKLLLVSRRGQFRSEPRQQESKGFLVLFFKKEHFLPALGFPRKFIT
jgi:hypothetical protein